MPGTNRTWRIFWRQKSRSKWRVILRGLGLFASSALVLGCIYVISQDRPKSLGTQEAVSLSYSCPPKTQLIVLTVPGIDIILQDHGGYEAGFSAAVASNGPGLCRVFLEVPRKSDSEMAPDSHTGIMKVQPGGLSGKVAVGTALAYSQNWRNQPNSVLQYSFTSSENTLSTGWGRDSFNFTVQTGTFGEQGRSSFPEGAPEGEQDRVIDLTVTCPYGSSFASEYPNNSQLQMPDKAIWQVPSDNFGQVFAGSCENPQIRFWVDHTTDGITLGLGALLGVLVTRDSPKGKSESTRSRTARTPNQPLSRRTARRISTHMRLAVILLCLIISLLRRKRTRKEATG